jgi:CRP-like cAMP-binding protein
MLGVSRTFGRTVVQVAGEALVVNARDATRLLCDQPNTSTLTRRYIFAFMNQVGQAGACNRLHTSDERCARWLLMTHDRAGSDQFSLTQEFLAAMMGTRRATVNLALSALRSAGAIDYSYRTLKVLDREQLETFSCPCYAIIQRAFEVVKLDSPFPYNCQR